MSSIKIFDSEVNPQELEKTMIKNFYKIKEEFDNKSQNELHKTGIFYAFSNSQWEEYRTYKENSTDKDYLTVYGGAYIHKNDKSKLDNYFKNILPKLKKELVNNVGIDSIIEYELINHECFYTEEWNVIIPVIENYLGSDISERNDIAEQIEIIYNKNYNKNMEAFE